MGEGKDGREGREGSVLPSKFSEDILPPVIFKTDSIPLKTNTLTPASAAASTTALPMSVSVGPPSTPSSYKRTVSAYFL